MIRELITYFCLCLLCSLQYICKTVRILSALSLCIDMLFVYYCPSFVSFFLLINSQIGKQYMNTKITSTLFTFSLDECCIVVLIPICILLPILTKISKDIYSTFLYLEGANDQWLWSRRNGQDNCCRCRDHLLLRSPTGNYDQVHQLNYPFKFFPTATLRLTETMCSDRSATIQSKTLCTLITVNCVEYCDIRCDHRRRLTVLDS